MNAFTFKNSVLPAEERINFITVNPNGTFRCEAINRSSRTIKCNYKEYKTILGAAKCNEARQNGGITVLVEMKGTDWAKADLHPVL